MKDRRQRKYVAIREKWAAALSMLLPQELRDDLREKQVPAKTIISMFDQDHVVFHAIGGDDRWWNFTPMLRAEHREKSRRDTAAIAKGRQIHRAQEEHHEAMRRKLLAPTERPAPKRSRWGKRKMESRNTFQRRPA